MKQILLVEPDRRVAELYKSALEAGVGDLHVAVASHAQEGLFAVDSIKPAVVLLELDLPDHSGFEFLYEFVSYDDWKNIPICILSRLPQSYYDKKMSVDWSDMGVREYWYKAETPLYELQQLLSNQLIYSS